MIRNIDGVSEKDVMNCRSSSLGVWGMKGIKST